MRRIIINGFLAFALGVMIPGVTPAQGTITYLSNLGQPSAINNLVGSDSWAAASFRTGTNASGYALDSIQVAMLDASGSPGGFAVMLFSAIGQIDVSPGTRLVTLTGSLSPVTSGVFSYLPASSFPLSPSTVYFIVLTGGSPVADGAYYWSTGTFPVTYSPAGGWRAPIAGYHFDNYRSPDGLSWNFVTAFPQFAINATAVPEPSILGLSVLGGLGFLWHGRRRW